MSKRKRGKAMKQRFEKEMSKLERELERERTTALESMENRLRELAETAGTIEVEYRNALPADPESEG